MRERDDILEEQINDCELRPVAVVGPCPLCGQMTIKNDRGGTTCVACAINPSDDAVMSRRRGETRRIH